MGRSGLMSTLTSLPGVCRCAIAWAGWIAVRRKLYFDTFCSFQLSDVFIEVAAGIRCSDPLCRC